jgi:ribonuclease HI
MTQQPSVQSLKKGRYLLNTDGGVKNDGHRAPGDEPGEAAIGIVLNDPGDRPFAHHSERIGRESIPGAEYRALIKGLQLARDHGIDKIRAFVDNQLVVDQINERSAVKDETLKRLHKQAMELLKMFADQRVYWVPRERNKGADDLVRNELYGRPEVPLGS